MPPPVDALGSREALLKAAVRPEAKLVAEGQKHAVKIKEGMKKAGESDSPVADLDKHIEATKPVNHEKSKKLIDNNVGTEVDPATGAKRLPKSERERKKRLTNLEEISSEMAEDGGIDKLIAAGRESDVIELAEIALTASPDFADIFPDKTTDPAARKEEIIAFLKQPGMAQKIKAEYNTRLNEDAKLENEVTPAQEALRKAEAEEKAKQSAVKKNNDDLTTTTGELEQFDPGKIKATKLEKLKADLPKIESDLELAQYNLESVSKDLDRLRLARINALTKDPKADVSALDTEIATKETARIKYSGEVKGFKVQIKEKEDLETERRTLGENKQRLENAIPQLEEELRQTTVARITAKADLDEKVDGREDQEQGFENNIRNIITQAVAKQLRENLVLGEQVRSGMLEKLENETTDLVEKGYYRGCRIRYEEPKKEGLIMSNKGETQDNKLNINTDYDKIVSLDPAKRQEVMRDQLDAGLKATVPDATERARIIDEKMNDPKFVEKMTGTSVEAVVAGKMRIGKITLTEGRTIMENYGEDILKNARTRNSNLDKQLAELTGEGIIDKTLFKKLSDSKLLRILMLLLLGTAAVGAIGIAGPAIIGSVAAGAA